MIIPLFSFLSLIKRCILKESFITLASKKKDVISYLNIMVISVVSSCKTCFICILWRFKARHDLKHPKKSNMNHSMTALNQLKNNI